MHCLSRPCSAVRVQRRQKLTMTGMVSLGGHSVIDAINVFDYWSLTMFDYF